MLYVLTRGRDVDQLRQKVHEEGRHNTFCGLPSASRALAAMVKPVRSSDAFPLGPLPSKRQSAALEARERPYVTNARFHARMGVEVAMSNAKGIFMTKLRRALGITRFADQ
jgi:hypothetical protein